MIVRCSSFFTVLYFEEKTTKRVCPVVYPLICQLFQPPVSRSICKQLFFRSMRNHLFDVVTNAFSIFLLFDFSLIIFYACTLKVLGAIVAYNPTGFSIVCLPISKNFFKWSHVVFFLASLFFLSFSLYFFGNKYGLHLKDAHVFLQSSWLLRFQRHFKELQNLFKTLTKNASYVQTQMNLYLFLS